MDGQRRRSRTGAAPSPWVVAALLALVVTGATVALSSRGGGPAAPVAVEAAVDGVDGAGSPGEPAAEDPAADDPAAEREQRAAEERAAEERAAEEERAAAAEEERREEERRAEDEERRAEDEARRAEEERQAEEEEARATLVAAQERLVELGYLVGRADGEQGQQTTAALMAFQAVNGIQVDGILGPQTVATLAEPLAAPSLRGGPATRLEVDLDRQVMHLVEGGERIVTLKISSGNGATYTRPTTGGTARALTPVGSFTIQRRIAGAWESTAGLGTMYDPLYFHRGFAVHGSNSVPAGPASHGCVRVTRADGRWLFARVPDGTAVVLYGGQHTFTPR